MNALHELARKRVDQSRQLRRGWSWFCVFVTFIAICGFLSLSVSFWIFTMSENISVDFSHLNLRKFAPIATATPVTHLSLADLLAAVRDTTIVYPDVPGEATQCASANTEWLQKFPSKIERVSAKNVLIPIPCPGNEDDVIGKVLAELDTDGTVAGANIVWVFQNGTPAGVHMNDLVSRSKSGSHLIYPRDFIGAASLANSVSKTELVWEPSMPISAIPLSNFCWFDQTNFHSLAAAVASDCMPAAATSTVFPMRQVISWDPIVARVQPGISAATTLGSISEEERADIRKRLGELRFSFGALPLDDAILSNLVGA